MSGSTNNLIMDIFRQDAFGAMTLTNAIEKVPYLPGFLGSLPGLFTPMAPLYTQDVLIESRDNVLRILPTSNRGEPVAQRRNERRTAKSFRVPRLAYGDTIYGSELQFVRQFGDVALMQVQQEVARRMSGPTGLVASHALTWERHRLSAVRGRLIDADGTEIYNWFTEFGISEPAEYAFNLAARTERTLRPICNQVLRAVLRGAKLPEGVGRVMALCGDNFFDDLTVHPDVEKTYLNTAQAAEVRQSGAFQTLDFAGITWVNYRGTDDNSTVAVATDSCHFFPYDAPGVFGVGFAPGEFLSSVGQPGKQLEVQTELDKADPPSWWKMNTFSYPIHICYRPEALQRGRRGA